MFPKSCITGPCTTRAATEYSSYWSPRNCNLHRKARKHSTRDSSDSEVSNFRYDETLYISYLLTIYRSIYLSLSLSLSLSVSFSLSRSLSLSLSLSLSFFLSAFIPFCLSFFLSLSLSLSSSAGLEGPSDPSGAWPSHVLWGIEGV